MSDNQVSVPELEFADRTPIPRSIVEHIQRLILKGGLKAGDRLPSQRELAEQMGVSRPSLREALTVLETMGLVTVRAGSGVFVAKPDSRGPLWRYSDRCTPADVYEARLGLEGYAARLAAARIDQSAELRLTSCTRAMRHAFETGDIIGVAAKDAEFHDLIFELCGNPILAAMYRPVREILVESQRLPMAHLDRLSETVREHEVIQAGILNRNPEEAEAAMQDHIRKAASRYGIAL
ncbi:GntR family transcriptional repressor for pyruvate dehydrogenase complex [Microvirga flocculans]|uniref:GntR family transcriptional repressor for pyruvate dehydrogenase complex n=1 Tax=Microvirga flocculans TaxID=217168 RepID=A0A7W6IG71_9HYPH|nr:FadR/GntR family transcriptional regulator [Microvirga flocculans]MBB4040270.1 GntR family transcriptional repressor for pyruvate dehydrogenase complex [Microvirga flocculans]